MKMSFNALIFHDPEGNFISQMLLSHTVALKTRVCVLSGALF